MADERNSDTAGRPLGGDDPADPEFQQRYVEGGARLGTEQMERAFRHGFDARLRFADRPFDEVESYLRESWNGMATGIPWERVRDVVGNGYERYKGAGTDGIIELGPEALDRFPDRTVGGSATGGVMGERNFGGGGGGGQS